MQPMYVSIQQDATGRRIKALLAEKGFTVREVQETMGFENPQAVYKWLYGQSLPSVDNLVVLSKIGLALTGLIAAVLRRRRSPREDERHEEHQKGSKFSHTF